MTLKRVVVITGCDSGLGWAMAARSAREGMVTIAGMYNGADTEAARALKHLRAHPCKLDVTDADSVTGLKDGVTELLQKNPNYQLYAVVNNAGVTTIGNYEWQTPQIIENTINVNLLGAMRVVSSFLPDLRRAAMKGTVIPRIINVTSHCGVQALPGFAPYSASKAGLIAWTNALRYENYEFGLKAVSLMPGGFVGSSNLLGNQVKHGKEMLQSLDEEQKALFENKIIQQIMYLEQGFSTIKFDAMKDENILQSYIQALNAEEPKPLYKIESWRYKMYYNLLKMPFSEATQMWLLKKFLSLP